VRQAREELGGGAVAAHPGVVAGVVADVLLDDGWITRRVAGKETGDGSHAARRRTMTLGSMTAAGAGGGGQG